MRVRVWGQVRWAACAGWGSACVWCGVQCKRPRVVGKGVMAGVGQRRQSRVFVEVGA